MKVVIQVCKQASVKVDGIIHNQIKNNTNLDPNNGWNALSNSYVQNMFEAGIIGLVILIGIFLIRDQLSITKNI